VIAGDHADRPRSTARAIALGLIVGFAVVGLILGIRITITHLVEDPLADVRAYYDAGARLNAGLPLYVPVSSTNEPGSYHYPPLLAILFRPLALLPYEVAALLWAVVMVGATVLTFRRIGLSPPVLIAAGLLAVAILWTATIGQVQAVVTLLLAIGAPWAVALATSLKLYPILVAVFWVGRRDWRSISWLFGWLVALAGIQFLLEPSGTIAYLGFLRAEQVADSNNLSLFGVSPVLWLVSVVVLAIVALRLAPTRWGWAAAVVFSVFASPRLLSFQLSTLLAGFGGPRDTALRRDGTGRLLPTRRRAQDQ
jgi:hypothetical protein